MEEGSRVGNWGYNVVLSITDNVSSGPWSSLRSQSSMKGRRVRISQEQQSRDMGVMKNKSTTSL